MNRLPKYRAFHKTEKKMYEVTNLDFVHQEVSILREFLNADMTPRGEFYEGIVGLSEVELMEYAGLPDKNGVDIFEADVAQLHKSTVIIEIILGSFVARVIDAGSPGDRNGLYYHMSLDGKTVLPFKVIGNIHSNPELLKQP